MRWKQNAAAGNISVTATSIPMTADHTPPKRRPPPIAVD
jgi:hypothetical protein